MGSAQKVSRENSQEDSSGEFSKAAVIRESGWRGGDGERPDLRQSDRKRREEGEERDELK